jgi:hypothetical protein
MEAAQVKSNGTNGHSKYSSPDQILQLALEITASIATSLQEALEHASRHEKTFEGFEDDDKVEDGDDDKMDADEEHLPDGDDEEDDEMNEEEIEADMDLVLGDGPDEEDEGPIEEATLDRLVRIAAPAILRLAQPLQADKYVNLVAQLTDVALSHRSEKILTITLRVAALSPVMPYRP